MNAAAAACGSVRYDAGAANPPRTEAASDVATI